MQSDQFRVTPAQYDWSMGDDKSGGQGGQLSGLMGLNQQQPNAFESQTPGAPQQPGRVDAAGAVQDAAGGEMDGDFFSMLAANIASAFGGG